MTEKKKISSSSKKKLLIEIAGWYGTAAILGAYSLSSFSFITPENIWYKILNLTGAIGIVLISYIKKAYQPMILNLIWMIIALLALLRQ